MGSRRCSTRATADTRGRSSSPALERGADLVVCDRYVARTLAHQGVAARRRGARAAARVARQVEYGEFALPRPDLVVLLDAPAALARELVARKGARAYTTLEADIHESDTEHGDASREVYLELARATAGASSGRRRGRRRARRRRDRRRDLAAVEPLCGPRVSASSALSRAARGEAPARRPRSPRGPRTRISCTARRASASATLALLFAAELLGDHARVERRTHPDLYVLEPLGDQIRIDDIRELRRDLHMRPFEASRRVYLIFGADTMNEDAADALLKDLEEPPSYAVIVLVADDLGPLPETIRSRCQLVPFRRLSERAVRDAVRARAPELPDEEVTTLARVAGGRLDRAERLLDPAAAQRREALLGVARAVYLDPEFDAGDGARRRCSTGIAERGAEAKEKAEETVAVLELTGARGGAARAPRAARRRARRAARRRSRSSSGGTATSSSSPPAPRRAVVHVDRLEELARRRDARAAARRRARVRDRPRGVARGRGAAALDRRSRSRPCSSACAASSAGNGRSQALDVPLWGTRCPPFGRNSPVNPHAGVAPSATYASCDGCARAGPASRLSSGGDGLAAVPSIGRAIASTASRRAEADVDARALRALREPDLPLLPAPARLARGGRGRRPEHVPERVPRASSAASCRSSSRRGSSRSPQNVCLSRRRSSWRRGRIESPTDFDVVEELTPAPRAAPTS